MFSGILITSLILVSFGAKYTLGLAPNYGPCLDNCKRFQGHTEQECKLICATTYSTISDGGFCKHVDGNDLVMCMFVREGGKEPSADICKNACTFYKPCVGYVYSPNDAEVKQCSLIPSSHTCPSGFFLATSNVASVAKTINDLAVRLDPEWSCYAKNRRPSSNHVVKFAPECNSTNPCPWGPGRQCCFEGICDSCDMRPYPARQRDFRIVSKKNKGICQGHPNPNYRRPLLKGKVTLERCSESCRRRKFCFGFEFWDNKPGNSANCFECPTFPNKKYTIKVIASSSSSSRIYSTVFQKAQPNMRTNKGQCRGEFRSCGRRPGSGGRCCAHLKCRRGTCMRRKECWLSGQQGMSCPKGWYCSGVRGGCRKCQVKHNKEPSQCRNNYLGGQCTPEDQKLADINEGKQILDWFQDCVGLLCVGNCAARCMAKHGFSQQCLSCIASGATCLRNRCILPCTFQSNEKCKKCANKKCMPDFITCSGLSFPVSDKFIKKFIEELKDQNNRLKSR